LTQNEVINLRTWITQPDEDYYANDTLSKEVSITTNLISNYFTASLDDQELPQGWFVDNPDGEITWVRSREITGANGLPTHAMYMNHFSYGEEGEEDYLYLAPLNLSALTDPGLLFNYSHAQFSGYFDTLRIEVFPGCDLNAEPTLLWELGDPEYATATSNGIFQPESGNDWQTGFIDLTPIANSNAIIRFTSVNGFGNSAFVDNIGIQAFNNSAPIAEFSAPDTICRTASVVFQATPNALGTYSWSFGSNSQPTSAEGAGPHTVTFPVAGSKIIRLIVNNPFGADTMTHLLRIIGQPIANFTTVQNGNSVNFTNTSTNAATYLWNFGDGNTSTVANPSHEYANSGTYTVTLSAQNFCTASEKSNTISYTTAALEATGFHQVDILPNPNNGQFQVLVAHQLHQLNAEFNLIDMNGRIIHKSPAQTYSSGVHVLNYDHLQLAAGQYQLQINTDRGSVTLTVLVQ
jgi:PKD domain/Secretion system C-terminal sorting domain